MENKIELKELQLEGFHCADCAVTIEKTVSKLNGVQSVEAVYTSGKVKVAFNPEKLRYDHLVQSVEKIGYKVQTGTHLSYEKRNICKDRAFHFTMISGLSLGLAILANFFNFNVLVFELAGRAVTLSIVFYLLSIFFGAYFFAKAGWAAVKNVHINMNFLMTFAILGAIFIQEYIEAASLAFLFSLAELLESYAVERARNSLRELMTLTPDTARVKNGKSSKTVSVDEVQVDDTIIVRPGEKIALDGVVTAGASSVDQAPITGESVPVNKEIDEKVYAGSINVEGYLEIKVTERSGNSMISRIIRLIEDAEKQKSPSERFVDKFAKIYTPAVVGLAVAVAVVPPMFFGAAFAPWFTKALTLLVIACPCALVISTPVSVVSALTSASKNGILIKGGTYLEEMSHIKVIVFDKTGTLTSGNLTVTDIISLNSKSRDHVLAIAASLESRSSHPIANAISETADGRGFYDVTNFQSIPGKGVKGDIADQTFFVGREEMFDNFSIKIPQKELQTLRSSGKTTMLVGTQNEIIAVIGLLDDIRKEAIETIAKLQKSGKKVIMMTGDNEQTAKAIAERLNLRDFKAGLLPEEKVSEIQSLKQKYGKVAMVGDGINDAPALAAASVGIAMGVAGTDTALETANIALMSDDLTKLPYLVTLSIRARKVIKQNIIAAILLKFTLAAGVFPGLVSLVTAVIVGDMGASLGVTGNAMKLAKTRSAKNS